MRILQMLMKWMGPVVGLVVFLFALGLFMPAPARAEGSVLDQFSFALLGHTETILESTTRGVINAEVLATPFQLGKWDGDYIVGLDGGVLGNVKPSVIGQAGYNWTAGLHFHLSPLLKKIMPQISPNYPALANLELNPRVSYVFRNRTNEVKSGWQLGLGVGWSFGLTPNP